MIARQWCYRMVQFSALAIALAVNGWPARPAAAANALEKLDSAAKLIPGDAAFYTSLLRTREQFEAVRQSRAWAKIREMPVVQMGVSVYAMQSANPGSRVAQFEAALKNPEIRKIVDLAGDMVSEEIFVYGDKSCGNFLKLMQDVNMAMSYGPMVLQATGQAKGRNPNHLQAMMVISSLAQHTDLIDAPNLVIGFKLKNTDLAKEQLIKLETIGNILLESNEKTKGRFNKTKVGSHDYLVLNLDGGMVPWDALPMDALKKMEAAEGDAQKVIDRLKEAKLVLALGIHDNYLLLSIGSSTQCLERLGQGERLIDRPEFKPLAKFAGERLTSIGYLSEEMNRQVNNPAKNLDELRGLLDKLLPLAKLSDEQNTRIRKDAESLVTDLKSLLPKVGARMGLSFLAARGVESYQYAWGDFGRLDGSKPLTLLQHVGGNPILGAVARVKVTAADYDLVVKWLKTGYGYFEEFGLPNMPEPQREKVKKFLTAAMPLFQRLDKVNREMRMPALADGQLALVIDGKLQSKHFLESLPTTEKPMPLVEPALVRSVSDAELLKQALGEYRTIVNGLIDAARQIDGVNIPEDVQIPAPQVSEDASGTVYSFTLPKEWGVDEKVVPNIGVSNEVLVISASKSHTERLLKATPLAAAGMLGKADRPLAAAAWLDWAALVEAATPWVDFGIERAASSKGVDEDQQKAIAEQVHTGLEVLMVLRSISSESYLEEGVLVNHALAEIRDVAK